MKLGVGPRDATTRAPADLAKYVLSRFAPDEKEARERVLQLATACAAVWLNDGCDWLLRALTHRAD